MSLLDNFLTNITLSLRNKNGQNITDLIRIDLEQLPPERQKPYVDLNAELSAQYPKENDEGLLERCRASVPDKEFTTFTSSFAECLLRYFRYVRDIMALDDLQKALDIRQLTR